MRGERRGRYEGEDRLKRIRDWGITVDGKKTWKKAHRTLFCDNSVYFSHIVLSFCVYYTVKSL